MIWPEVDVNHLMVSADQMRSIEIELFSHDMPVEALMEKVGFKIACWILNRPNLTKDGVVILVGPGHNGGDGLVVARELHLAGLDIAIWCPYPIKKKLTQKHLNYINWLGIPQLEVYPDIHSKSLWVEALFGLGQKKKISNELRDLFKSRQIVQPNKLISIDVPAGICSDSGKLLSEDPCHAFVTLTTGLVKKGLVQDSAIDYVGNIERIDIGIPPVIVDNFHGNKHLLIRSQDLNDFQWPIFDIAASKYQRGRTLLIAGSNKYLGAAYIALKGALGSGVGSIQAALPKLVAEGLWQSIPEIVLSQVLPQSNDGNSLIEQALLTSDLSKYDSILIGPGLGIENDWDQFCYLLEDFKGLLVLDADGLNRLSLSSKGWEWLKRRNAPTWITPHLSEFHRLFPCVNSSSLFQAAKEASRKANVAILLKGAHSVIAEPSGYCWQLTDSSSNVARAGLGDLLAGYLSGMGAMGVVSKKGLSSQLMAASALVHAEAARNTMEGTNANLISKTLAELTKRYTGLNVLK